MRPSTGSTAAVGAVGLWATNAAGAGDALAHLTVLQLLALQFGAAAVALGVTSLVRSGHRRATRTRVTPARARVVPAMVGVAGLTTTIFLQYLAFDTAPLVGANVICYADGLLAALWVAVRRPSPSTLAGVPLALVGFGGVAVIVTGDGPLGGFRLGYLFALGAAVGMAVYSLASGHLEASTTDVLLPATIVGTAVALTLSLARGENWPPVSDGGGVVGYLGAIYLGLGPMAAGYALWTHAMAGGRADRLVPISYATPLLSTVLLLVVGQPVTTATVIGGALILVCSVGALANQWRHGRRRPELAVTVPE